MSFPRLRFAVLVTSSCAAFAFACGGISDPTRGGNGEKVATVSGALTGTSVPANARVALVWRTPASTPGNGGYAVGDDVPVVAGKFSMSLAAPPAAYFSRIDGKGEFSSSSSSGGEPPSGGPTEPAPVPGGTGGSSGGGKVPSFGARVTPQDTPVSGGITTPLEGAVAGFVVYVDTNGNGKLDLAGEYATSSDQVLGGNEELVLAYLKDGGALDYEKLRDTSGILPVQGFNLAWTDGKRWMPLNVVELKLDPKEGLPNAVCSTSGYYGGGSSGGSTDGFNPVGTDPVPMPPPTSVDAGISSSSSSSGSSGSSSGGSSGGSSGSSGSSGTSSSGGGGSYPDPTDPNLHCAPDGRSFSYYSAPSCPPPRPAPVGLCAGDWGDTTEPCAGTGGWGESLTPGTPVPPGWPCPTVTDADAGPGGFDAGVPDSGK